MSNTIREDVVSISFDVANNPFADITAEVDEMKTAITGGVDDGTKKLKDLAKGAKQAGSGLEDTAQTAKKADKSFTDMLKGVKDLAKTKVGNGLAKGLGKAVTVSANLAKGLKKAAAVGFDKVTSGVKSLATHAAKAVTSLAKIGATGLVAGATAAAGAVAGLVTKSVQAYADFEQLTGGVETLFKDSAPKVQEYANNAYKTAGLSANEYMETVTSFSASLLQSVGGDTAKAASLADMAITDMADNANKMGSDMESIQNAYQGFAKQNYTMLDNLKLGYGGTKEEMQRLLKDAKKISGVKYDISSYADIVDAIHVVQTEMGITGTTAKEAEQTISGSLAGMKSAWGNLLTSLVQGGDSFDQNVTNLISSVKTFAGNVIPVAKSALSGIVTLISELAPVIMAEVPSLLSDLLPQVVNAGMQLVKTLLTAISANVGMISSGATQLITSFVQFITANLPQLILTGVKLLTSLVQGIAQQLPTLIPMAIQAIITLVNGLIGMLPQIISAGITLLESLAQGITQALPQLIPAGIQAIITLVNGLIGMLPQIISAGITLLVSLVQGITQALPQLIPAGIQALITLIQGITNAIPQLIQAALGLVPVIVNALIQNLPLLIQGGIQLIVALVSGLGQAIPQLIDFLPQIKDAILNSLKEIDLLQVGKDLISGFVKGIGSMLGAVKDAAKNVAKSAGNAIKSFLGINSPAKLTIGYGENTGEGLALGMDKLKRKVTQSAEGLSTQISTNVEPSVNRYTPSSSGVSNTSNKNVTNHFSPSFTLNMNGASATDSNKRKVKQWVKESIQETFESMGRTNPDLCEV